MKIDPRELDACIESLRVERQRERVDNPGNFGEAPDPEVQLIAAKAHIEAQQAELNAYRNIIEQNIERIAGIETCRYFERKGENRKAAFNSAISRRMAAGLMLNSDPENVMSVLVELADILRSHHQAKKAETPHT